MADLVAIHEEINACTQCALHAGRTHAVPGEGSSDAGIMFVGEGPGSNEDKQARPFVGAAGQFLNELLASIGLRREDVFITNMVKCRPPNNRDPLPDETEACSRYLDAQIATIAPEIIVPLGRHALARWFPNESIGKLRAHPKRFGEMTLFPLYHPAAALHNGGLRSTIEEDFAKLGALLKELRQQSASAEATPPIASPIVALTAAQPAASPEPVAATPEPAPEEPAGGQQLSMF